jgi:hypothetical protein
MANGARGTGSNQHRVVGSQPASPPPLSDLTITHTQYLAGKDCAVACCYRTHTAKSVTTEGAVAR